MFRRFLFWTHLALGVTAGVFIFVMAATGVVLAFEKQITDFVDRDIRWISVPNTGPPRPLSDLLETVVRAGAGSPTAVVVRNAPQAAIQISIGRGKTIYADPYSGAILGVSSAAAHSFFFQVERWHRAFGAPLGSKGAGYWLEAISNLLFGVLILLGVALWMPRRWSWKAVRASVLFRNRLHGRAVYWNWHNVFGIWCATPLLAIVLSSVVMSFPWANALLFQLSGSNLPVGGRTNGPSPVHGQGAGIGNGLNYDKLLMVAKTLNPHWRTITLNVAYGANTPVQVSVDTGTGGQPQKRTQYLLASKTGAILKTTTFADASMGQRMRAFV